MAARQRLREGRDRLDHLRVPHLARLRLAEQPCAVGQRAVAELHGEPAGHVVGADREAAGRRRIGADVRTIVERGLGAGAADRAVEAGVRAGAVGIVDQARIVDRRPVHADPPEDVLADELLPGLAADLLDQLAGDHVEHVVIGIAAAEARRRPDEAQARASSPRG